MASETASLEERALDEIDNSADPGSLSARNPSPDRRRVTHETAVMLLALAAGLPAVVLSFVLILGSDYTAKAQWTLGIVVLSFWFAISLKERVARPLQTISNLLAALGEGDYSVRGRGAGKQDALGAVMLEVNALGETLRRQRLDALEATTLLRKVMAELDVAVFTFNAAHRLALVNRAGERLLARPVEALLGMTADELGLDECLLGDEIRTLQINFPGGSGRWGMRRTTFREGGLPHQLIVLADLSHALREEERQAWQRLIRVLGHELNNSMAPIKSIAGSLENLLLREPPPEDWKEDMRRGLGVIASRSDALTRFMSAYSRLARLPRPNLAPVNVGTLVRRVVGLETRLSVALSPGDEMMVNADADQLEQLLINLVKNAVEAASETKGTVTVGWRKTRTSLDLWVDDEGPGLQSTSNLFVPFFTTKPEGSGIGLVLSRQIAEAHGGTLTLDNRKSTRGCRALLRLPL